MIMSKYLKMWEVLLFFPPFSSPDT